MAETKPSRKYPWYVVDRYNGGEIRSRHLTATAADRAARDCDSIVPLTSLDVGWVTTDKVHLRELLDTIRV